MERRSMMKWTIRGIGLATAGMIGIPSLVVIFGPIFERQPQEAVWRPIGSVDNFPVGEMLKTSIHSPHEDWSRAMREKAVYAWRPTEEEVIVYSRSCTDLGCPVTWDPGSECFFCPCHGGIFSKNGERMAGPPKRPLYRYASRIIKGVIEVDFKSLPPMA